jgi:hypothetical protein
MKQIELAQRTARELPEVEKVTRQTNEHKREGVAIFLVVVASIGVWVGSRLVFHIESLWVSLGGLGLLAVGWLAWKARCMKANTAIDADTELASLSLTLSPNGESAQCKEKRASKDQAVQPGVQAQGRPTE